MAMQRSETLAYIIGVALGDGNLSNPNGRAIRLRITCDARYVSVTNEIVNSLQLVFPTNRVCIAPGPKPTYFNISVYSNQLADIMPWIVGQGSKAEQQAHIPDWIHTRKNFIKAALRGLIQTDGSIYIDRGYTMLNFTNVIEPLALDVIRMMQFLGFSPTLSITRSNGRRDKYTVRLARDVDQFIACIALKKVSRIKNPHLKRECGHHLYSGRFQVTPSTHDSSRGFLSHS